MIWFFLGLVLLVVAVIATLGAVFSDQGKKGGPAAVAAIAGVCSLALLFGSSMREVPARSVGVPVSLGHVGQSMRPGLHPFQSPWEKVEILNEKIQTTYYDAKHCLQVRIGGQQLACWQGSIQWRVLDNAAPGLFNSYGNTGNIMTEIQDAVVTRNLQAGLTHTFQDYNPIVDVSRSFTAGNSQFSTFQPKLLAYIKHAIGRRIEISSLLMKNMIYNQTTQNVLEGIQQQQGKTAQAAESIKTNYEQNLANQKLSAQSLTPGVLANLCYNTVREAMQIRYQLPAGFSCSGAANLGLAVK